METIGIRLDSVGWDADGMAIYAVDGDRYMFRGVSPDGRLVWQSEDDKCQLAFHVHVDDKGVVEHFESVDPIYSPA